MARFDVCRNPDPRSREAMPYLLGVQSDLLDVLTTRVVVPLITAQAMGKPANYLNPCRTSS
jgi:toxin CcdB